MFCMVCLTACESAPETVQLAGETMGTSWHVSYVSAAAIPIEDEINTGIELRLAEVDKSMSTYRADSEISRFNETAAGELFSVSEPFFKVLTAALDIGERSEGAYDVTVAPLVSLWGFGPATRVAEPPSQEAITGLLKEVGQHNLRLQDDGRGVRKLVAVSLDFSSLAKGYAVDHVAKWLEAQGIHRYMVEVGGEMRLAGASGRGDDWHIAVEQPDTISRTAATALSLTDIALATSGDYRNYFEANGQRYSHSIDPRTGYPVAHDLVSVTVAHSSAMMADAWATALVVLGTQRAKRVAQIQGLAVYFIRREDADFVHSHTASFEPYLVSTPMVSTPMVSTQPQVPTGREEVKE
ncbi:MAG: thiamine biosynthesis lipoprotein [Halioglobus sp.]|jgi:thiamine biosynthesis lipoprotein